MFVIFGVSIYFDHADIGWLLGMSACVIGLIASMYREAMRDIRFYRAIGLYVVVHITLISAAFYVWKSLPAKAISPIFYLDFIAMGLLFPKLTGIVFAKSK